MNPDDIVPEGVTLRDFDDHKALRDSVFTTTLEGFKSKFPQEHGKYRMEVDDLHYMEADDEFDLAAQKKALMTNQFLAKRLKGTVKLYDRESGQLIDEKSQVLMRVPYVTDRGTTIHNGNEYVTLNQARLSSGIYTRQKQTGEIESQINAKRGTGKSYKIRLEPASSLYKLDIDQASLRLYSLLHDLGVSDDDMELRWGSQVLAANRDKYDPRTLDKAYKKLVKRPNPDASREEKVNSVKEALGMTVVSRGVVQRTLPNLFNQKTASIWRKSAFQQTQVQQGAQTEDEFVKWHQKAMEQEEKHKKKEEAKKFKRDLDARRKILELRGLNSDILAEDGSVDPMAVIKQVMQNVLQYKKTKKDIETKKMVKDLQHTGKQEVEGMKAEDGMQDHLHSIQDQSEQQRIEAERDQLLGQIQGLFPQQQMPSAESMAITPEMMQQMPMKMAEYEKKPNTNQAKKEEEQHYEVNLENTPTDAPTLTKEQSPEDLRSEEYELQWKNHTSCKEFRKHRKVIKTIQEILVQNYLEGNEKEVRRIQDILTNSLPGRILAVWDITHSKGSKTPGVDGVTWKDNDAAKWEAVIALSEQGYKAKPLRRIEMPKPGSNKKRPIGIPTMFDRCKQALYLMALDPIAEENADPNSYGFRKHRSHRDAIEQIRTLLSGKDSPEWILDADIESCFDGICHDWLSSNIPLDIKILKQWLGCGFQDWKHELHPTEEGTPQGGVISPCLCNMTLDGLEKVVKQAAGSKYKIHFVRYADDFIVTASDKEVLEQIITPAIGVFLKERGLRLSETKTSTHHVGEGVDYLGQHVRKTDGKLKITPSEKNVGNFLAKVGDIIAELEERNMGSLIEELNPVIKGWANYHRHVEAQEQYAFVDVKIHAMVWRFLQKLHSDESNEWIESKYLVKVQDLPGGGTFRTTSDEDGNFDMLFKASSTAKAPHIKIKGKSNPYKKEDKSYFRELEENRSNMNKRKSETSVAYGPKFRALVCSGKGNEANNAPSQKFIPFQNELF